MNISVSVASCSVPLPGVGTLQEVQVPIISQSSCQEMYSLNPKDQVDILYDMICAGYQEGGKDSCQVLLNQLFVHSHKRTLAKTNRRSDTGSCSCSLRCLVLSTLKPENWTVLHVFVFRGIQEDPSSARWWTGPGCKLGWWASENVALTGTNQACTPEWPPSRAFSQARYQS